MRILAEINEIIKGITDKSGRTQRQFQVLYKWAQKLFHGTFVACTGFGKTRVGIEALKLLRRNNPTRKVIVVVPTLALQDQWNKILEAIGHAENTEVWVINSLAASDLTHRCDLLILDEIHRYAAETFSKVFTVVNYKYILGLTATIERADGKHELLQRYAPVFDEVTLNHARAKGWVAEYEVVNYGIELSEEDQQEYDQLYGKDSKLFKYMAVFGYDLQLIIQCSFGNKPRFNTMSNTWFDPPAVTIARRNEWEGNNAYRASFIMRSNKDAPRGQKVNIWGNTNHAFHPDKVVGYAVQARRLIADRKQWINNHPLKTKAVVDIYNYIGWKTISFCETKQTAMEIRDAIGDRAVSYYSQMDSEYRVVTKTKECKRRVTVDKFMEKHPDIDFDLKEENGKFILSWQEEKLFGEKRLKEEALRKLQDNRYKINFISSVRSLNEGIDIPDLRLAIIHSRNSTARDQIQRIGRVARLFIYKDGSDKKPIIVNIYLKDTKDEGWLKAAMAKIVGERWVDNIEEILTPDDDLVLVA